MSQFQNTVFKNESSESEIIKQIAEHQILNRCSEKGMKRPINNKKMYLEKE
ncbi:hypothetical protein T01_15113 [Trichinella spiralis]|uniref:Uncharacterized protein n=1 Tax=Trichinella spiralis TaxID=6334 RepID=A0A0V0Z2W5_TRISP|nr:hypothetical protein T01_15113 [Trichinella spiralis]